MIRGMLEPFINKFGSLEKTFSSNIKACCSIFCISTHCQNCDMQMQPQLVYSTFYCRCVQRSPNIYYNIIFISYF